MPWSVFRAAVLIGASLLLQSVNSPAVLRAEEIILKGATIYDGSGAAPIVGDVVLSGKKIVSVGPVAETGTGFEINCQGLVVCPGFIDLHNHSDAQMVSPKTRGNVNFLLQGCTTVVTGNCGAGPVDAAKYFDKIDEHGTGTNVVHLLPQGSLRGQVLGSVDRKATAEELAEMCRLADKAMQDGVAGMSTGLIYVPGTYTPTDELIEVAKVVASHGGLYASHIRDEGTGLLGAVEEALHIGREAKLRVHVSHFKSSGPDAWGLIKQAAAQIEAAQKAGLVVTADQYPYIASSTSLEAMLIPTWAREGGDARLKQRLDDPETGARIRSAIRDDFDKRQADQRIRIARYSGEPRWAGMSLAEIAKATGRDTIEIVVEICRNGGAAAVNFGMTEEDVRYAMQLPWVATASDGRAYLPGMDRPHPRNYGTFPRKLGYYSIREKVLPLEQAIRSATGLPAEILGWEDRGLLKGDYVADVVVFDPNELIDTAQFTDPHRYAAGVKHVFVNGELAVYQGQPTGAQAGKALRRDPKKPGVTGS